MKTEKDVKKLGEEALGKVAGGTELEEAEYKTKGYQTPVMEQTPEGWHFEPVGGHLYETPKDLRPKK